MSSSRIRRTAILRVLEDCFWTPGWVHNDNTAKDNRTSFKNHIDAGIMWRFVAIAFNRTWANQPESAADPGQRQGAGKVLFESAWCLRKMCFTAVLLSLCACQYGVPVIKYDRRGFKPRPRQLLLTNTFAVLVDRTKIKQRLDYSALRGENQPLRPVDLSISVVK